MSKSKRRAPTKKPRRVRNVKIDWKKVLSKQKKSDLLEALVDLASKDRQIARQLIERFDVPLAPEDLVNETLRAIADATYVSSEDAARNINFHYDLSAYRRVERNLRRMVEAGDFPQAMSLALELMRSGSRQV